MMNLYTWDDVIYASSTSSFKDDRGEIWSTCWPGCENDRFIQARAFQHTKLCTNRKHVFRGFHSDDKTWKLTTCLSGKMTSFIIDPQNKEYKVYELDSKKHSRLVIPPTFYNGIYSHQDSIYLYHLEYNGEYSDYMDQKTLKIEDSCCNKLFNNLTNSMIRSARDSP